MKRIYGFIVGLVFVPISVVFAQGSAIDIPQIPKDAKLVNSAGGIMDIQTDATAEAQDYQTQVLSDPNISNVARAGSLTGGGGNIATVVQEGESNTSSVTQSGDDNYASQTQKGVDNDLQVEQNGANNHSEEHQVGEHNRKVKIQNGKRQETITLKQVEEEKDEENPMDQP